MNKSRKAQMEILGLAIVVVLVILALVFVLRFGFKEVDNIKGEVQDSQVAANYISTFLKTTSDCGAGMDGEALLQDCAIDGGITCSGGDSTCDRATDIAEQIFLTTLDEWKIPYHFAMYASRTDYDKRPPLATISIGTPCVGEKKSKTQPLTTDAGTTMFVVMDICR